MKSTEKRIQEILGDAIGQNKKMNNHEIGREIEKLAFQVSHIYDLTDLANEIAGEMPVWGGQNPLLYKSVKHISATQEAVLALAANLKKRLEIVEKSLCEEEFKDVP